MKLFRNIFAGEKKPLTLADKLAAFDGVAQQEIDAAVLGTAGDANDQPLRIALLPKASSGALMRLLADGHNPALEKRASELLAAQVDEGGLSTEALTAGIADTEKLLTVAAFSQGDGLESAVLETISDQALIVKLCRSATSTKVRQLLAEKITSPEELKTLAKSLKTKDKNAYKTIKTKLDAMRQAEQVQAESNEKIATVITEMHQLAQRDIDRETQPRLSRLQRHWTEVSEHASDEFAAQFAQAEKSCTDKLAAQQAALDAEEAHEAAVRSAGDARKQVLGVLWQIIIDVYAITDDEQAALSTAQETFAQQQEQWRALNELNNPSKHQLRDYTQLSEAMAQLHSDYEKNGTLNACYARVLARVESGETIDKTAQNVDVKYLRRLLLPIKSLGAYPVNEPIENTRALLQKVDADYTKRQQDQEKNISNILGLVRKASNAVEAGRLKQAIGVRHSITEKQSLLDGEPEFLQKKLESLDEAIQKLIDWQAYAVVPKKNALIAAMEKLVGADEPPEALATKIKKLQDEWKALSQSGKDRKEELWETFSALADKAYAPCKAFYEDLSQQRQANLAKRQELVKQLQDFYAQYHWDDAVWKDVEKILRTAKKELHGYVPVERAANKDVLTAFDDIHGRIQAKLDEEFSKNRAAKEQLIGQAEKLTQQADVDQAIESVKRLQTQWKTIGRCHFKDSEALWKNFRTHCDKIFEIKSDKNKAQRAATDTLIDNARAFVNQIVALCELEGDALLAARAERDQVQQAFSEVEGLPEKVEKAIARDLTKAAEAFDKKVANSLRESASKAWNEFFTACEKINHYQYAVVDQGSDDEALRAETQAFIEGVSQWPEGTQSLVKQQMKVAPEADTQANLKALKLLCIRAEILADHETPAADKALRMEYQVTLLQQGMGAQAARTESGTDIAKAWSEVGPVAAEDYNALFERFYARWRGLAL